MGQGKQGNAKVRREDTVKEEREIKKKEVMGDSPPFSPPQKKEVRKKK